MRKTCIPASTAAVVVVDVTKYRKEARKMQEQQRWKKRRSNLNSMQGRQQYRPANVIFVCFLCIFAWKCRFFFVHFLWIMHTRPHANYCLSVEHVVKHFFAWYLARSLICRAKKKIHLTVDVHRFCLMELFVIS